MLYSLKLIKRIGPINASFVTYLVPLSSISLGIIFLGESLTFVMTLGGLLIFLGVFFANNQKVHKTAFFNPIVNVAYL